MGAVYRAADRTLNREVAIKVLPQQLSTDPEHLARFQRKRVLASLNHPNIAAIHGIEENALVMELAPGPTLEQGIAADPMPLENTLSIARQVADVLEAAPARPRGHLPRRRGVIKSEACTKGNVAAPIATSPVTRRAPVK